jgi:hypothetical protein
MSLPGAKDICCTGLKKEYIADFSNREISAQEMISGRKSKETHGFSKRVLLCPETQLPHRALQEIKEFITLPEQSFIIIGPGRLPHRAAFILRKDRLLPPNILRNPERLRTASNIYNRVPKPKDWTDITVLHSVKFTRQPL